MTRRRFQFLVASSTLLQSPLRAFWQGRESDPWGRGDLMEPGQLAGLLNSSASRPALYCVAFPVLYRQRHIIHAEFAGPASKPEGLESLKNATARLSKDAAIVIYCGCCPMVQCPNIRPAYKALKEAGFRRVRVLNLPQNLHTDWIAKGFPVEEQLGVPVRPPR